MTEELTRLLIPIEGDDSGFKRTIDGTTGLAGTWAVALGNIVADGFMKVVEGAADLAQQAVGGVVDVIGESIGVAKDFQSSLADLGLAAKSTGLTYDELHDIALQVGGDTSLLGVSASGAAESLTGLFKSGLSAVEVFGDLQGYMNGTAELGGALRAAIDLAAASELDMVGASDLAVIALSSFGSELKTEEERAAFVTSALDNFVRAADASVADVTGLGDALKAVGPTAAAMGFSIEDVNTALAILSTRGIQGSEAGTALKSMLTNMQRPTKAVQEALNALGVEIFDSQGNMKALSEIVADFDAALNGTITTTTVVGGRTKEQQDELDRLKKMYASTTQTLADYEAGLKGAGMTAKAKETKLAALRAEMAAQQTAIAGLEGIEGRAVKSTRELTQEEQLLYIQTIAGTYGMNAMNTLLGEGAEGWAEMADAIAGATGIQEQAATKAATFAGQMEAFDGQMEALKIQIGEAFLPIAANLVSWAMEMADQYGPQLVEIFEGIAGAAAYLFEVLIPVDSANDWMSQIPEAAQPAVAAIGELVAWLRDQLPVAIQTASDFWTNTLQPALAAVWSWVQESLIPALSDLWAWLQDQLPEAISTASSFWTETLEPAIAGVKEALGNILAFWEEHGPSIQQTASEVFERFVEVGQQMIDEIIPWIVEKLTRLSEWYNENGPLIESYIDTIGEVWLWLAGTVEEAWDFIQPILDGLFEIILDLAELIMEVATGDWAGAWETMQDLVDTAVLAFEGFVLEFLDWIVKLLGGESWEDVKAMWENNWALFETIVSTTWTNLIDSVGTFVEDIGADLSSKWDTFKGFGEDIINGFIDGARAKAQSFIDAVVGPVGDAIEAARRLLHMGSPSRLMFDMAVDTFEGFDLGAAYMAPKVQQAFEQTITPRLGWEGMINANLRGLDQALQPSPVVVNGGDTYQLTAQYRYQSEMTLMDQVSILQSRSQAGAIYRRR